jgi:aspartyl/asparaginyl beta-hydroxylase (cupin superfamily)
MNRESKSHSIIQTYSNFLEDFFGGICIRSFLANLSPFKNISSHVDLSDTLTKVHRCHLPIITNEEVIFGIGKNEYNLKEGILYEVNNTDYHYVNNNSSKNRIHLIIDILQYKYNRNILKLYKDT